MTEWGVVGVIVVLIGLFATVGAPALKLYGAIVKLTTTCSNLGEKIEKVESDEKERNNRLWQKNDLQDVEIRGVENRVTKLEEANKKTYSDIIKCIGNEIKK